MPKYMQVCVHASILTNRVDDVRYAWRKNWSSKRTRNSSSASSYRSNPSRRICAETCAMAMEAMLPRSPRCQPRKRVSFVISRPLCRSRVLWRLQGVDFCG